MIISDMDMIAQDMVCIAERADGKGKVEGYYFCLHHNDGRTHLHHLIIPLEADLSRGTPLDQIQVEVVPESITLKAQEPRVMELEEITAAAFGGGMYWLEFRKICAPALMIDQKVNYMIEFAILHSRGYGPVMVGQLHPNEYKKVWRCWTGRPTDEQREAVKWDE